MNFPFIASIVLHSIFLIIMAIEFKNPFDRRFEDKGYAVFEFKEISSISKAPIISKTESHVNKTKSSKKETPEDKANIKKVENNTKSKIEQKNENVIKLKDTKKNNKKKKNVKAKKQPKSGATRDKAVVNLKKVSKKSTNKSPDKTKKKAFDSLLSDAIAKSDDNENEGIKAEQVGEVLTATQIDLIRQTIRKCWHFPAGLKNAEDLSVDIKMKLAEDGTVVKAEIVDNKRMNSDANFRTAAENAYRAVLDPNCNPLPLPKEKYDEWKDLELTFNPKDMFE